MADESSTYSLRWEGDFAEKARESADAGQALARVMERLQRLSTAAATPRAPVMPKIPDPAPRPLAPGARSGALNLRALSRALRMSGGEAGAFLGRGTMLVNIFSRLAASPVGVAIALGVLALALVAATVALASFALSSSDAARSQRLLAEASTGSAHGAEILTANAREFAASTGMGLEAASKLGNKLAQAGLAGRDLANAMQSAAIASSALGDEAGNKLTAIAEQVAKLRSAGASGGLALSDAMLSGSGVKLNDVAWALANRIGTSVQKATAALQAGKVDMTTALDALNSAVEKKLGRIARLQALALPKQFERFKANVHDLFAGSNIEPFLNALKDVLSVFDSTTITGRALKAAITGLSQPLIDAASAGGPIFKAFLQGMVIALLQISIILLKVRNYLRDAFGGELGGIDGMTAALLAGKVVLYSIAAGFALVAAGVALVVGPLVLFVLAIKAAYDFIANLDFGEIGSNLVDGFVSAILGGVGAVTDAVTNLATGARDTLKRVLGIHSPSLVFAQLGMQTAEGFARGVDEGAGGARGSVADMVGSPKAETRAGGAAGPRVLWTGNIVIQARDAQEINSDGFMTRLVRELEKSVLLSGASMPVPEGT
jgi:hypothetical protein